MRWNDLSVSDKQKTIGIIRELAANAPNSPLLPMNVATMLFAAADELENPTWDDDDAPSTPGEIVR